MKQAKVVTCAPVQTMESNRPAMQVITDLPYAVAGQRGPWTAFYLRPDAPRFPTDTPIAWDHHHAEVAGVSYPRLSGEDEFDPTGGMH